ncbi:39S mitochondrial ribosomal protein L46-domain-containing protein [Cokeromyces recurvatus]|uniref:39S mitochondrial ribosomal protein L46-domain-containing protein n=1 Tax=Cokeromyces recurvatus TaxID=90255 RepID=UPI00222126CD|nr:39S mitochondrial ribosomal protein L46-domain-containing protein [Cokeromyces recurvatus]KAI7902426.1 39S mitochondrial ribosomal protein L46-domain-containing protein [Cokeromyces recurvatus]
MLKNILFNSKRGLATISPLVIKNSRIQASVILSRTPQITRDATPFEKAYFDYREKLERQESTTTPTEFYFKKGSVAERRWKNDEEAREKVMNDPTKSMTEAVEESRIKWESENENLVAANKVEKLGRVTKADLENDTKSLDRALQRTLYLVVKNTNDPLNPWQFPQGPVDTSEYLHEAAKRTLQEQCGADMDTWFVGRQPISIYKQSSTKGQDNGVKTFFMKARVYAGQVKPGKDISDFAWLTKEELVNTLSRDYYKAVKDSLGDL